MRAIQQRVIRRIEDFSFSTFFANNRPRAGLVLSERDEDEIKIRGVVSSIDNYLTLTRDDGYQEEFAWWDINRIAVPVQSA